MERRRRFKQSISLADRLRAFAKEAGERAAGLPPGAEREELIKKVRQAETALHLEGWTSSEGAPLGQARENNPLTEPRRP